MTRPLEQHADASPRAAGTGSLVTGAVGITLGAFAVLLSAVPMGAFLGWPLALVAIVLGVVALCLPGRRTALAVGGLGLAALAFPVGVVVPFLLLLGFAGVARLVSP